MRYINNAHQIQAFPLETVSGEFVIAKRQATNFIPVNAKCICDAIHVRLNAINLQTSQE